MEKLVPRPSGGGAKLGTLDMQSYLEVMGRQLAEIQAQHQQFYASRQDRLGRLRHTEHGQGGQPSPEDHELARGSHAHDAHAQSPAIVGASTRAPAGARSSSASQGGARRSLNFGDDSPGGDAPEMGAGADRHPSGRPGTGAQGSRRQQELRAFNSTPPLTGFGSADAGGQMDRGPHPQASSGYPHAGQGRSSKHSGATPAALPSPSASRSISPSSASYRPQSSTPGTPSVFTAQTGATDSGTAPPGSVSTSATSSAGPYAVYEVSSIACASYPTPEAHGGDGPPTDSVSGSSHGAWRRSRVAASSASPTPSRAVLKGISDVTPSAASVSSSAVAMHEHDQDVSPGEEGAAASDEEGVAIALSLAGRAFDGIDSEEDDESEPCTAETGGGDAGAVGHARQAPRHRLSRASVASEGAGAAGTAGGEPAGGVSLPEGDAGGRQSVRRGFAVPQLDAAATSGSRPQSRGGTSRAPLVAASLETEEALRALLATPRFAAAVDAPVGASIDVEGIEVPDDVLAALAKTDGMDLDVALGAAVAATLRGGQWASGQERERERERLSSAAGRAAGQGQGQGQGSAQLPPTAHGRHPLLGPGALTAAPAAVPPAVASRGFDASLRSGASATSRAAGSQGGPGSAAPGELPPRSAQYHFQHPPAGLSSASVPVDASLEVDGVDLLSQTIEIAPDALPSDPTLRDSVAVAAMAIAAQRAAAQQHPQPVLYSVVPARPPEGPGSRRSTTDGEGRRGTMDGEGRRGTMDGESRRHTGDGSGLLLQLADEQEDAPGDARSGVLAPSGGSSSSRAGSRPGTTSPSAAAPAGLLGRGMEAGAAAASPSRAASRGAITAASPTTLLRQGGDTDVVLYGSPSTRNPGSGVDAGASPGAPGGASPYVAPSPPPGADPNPYMHSPPPSNAGSRLQRSSRKAGGVGDLPASPRPPEDGGPAVHDGDESQAAAAAAATGAAAGLLRPWSSASNSSRRLGHSAGSVPSSNASSANLDLSLTQAAAAAAMGTSKAQAGSVPSPTGSQRHIRPGAPTPLQVSQAQPRQQQQQEAGQHPAYSSFSVVGLSPSAARGTQVASYDLAVDDAGRPFSPSQSPKAAATTSAAGARVAAVAAGDNSLVGQQPQQQQLQPQQVAAPPLAAFSRAAALAAAADVGLPAPPATAAERRPQPTADSGAGLARAGAGAGSTAAGASTAGGSDGGAVRGSETLLPEPSREEPLGALRSGAPSAGDYAACLAQSPSVGASSAKLTQLKARRQQQWQSQQGLQGAPESASVSGAAAALPPEHQHQPPPPEQQHPSSHHHSQGDGHSTGNAAAGSNRGIESPGPSAASAPSRPPPSSSAPGGAGVPGGSALPAPASPLLPQAVVEAIATAASAGKEAVRGELNLGHGISGLSVAIEAGQVKWAWQTEVKGKAAEQGHARDRSPAAAGMDSAGSSRAASPSGAHSGVRDSSAEWALQQLPPPQWQRHGQLPPPGSRGFEAGGRLPPQAPTPPPPPHQGPPQLEHQRPYNAANRRHSEYSLPERKAVTTSGGAPQLYYACSAGGSGSSGQGQDQGGPFRNASASDAGAHAGGKALALLRLKQQSILRHNVSVPGGRESEGQSTGQQQQEQQQRTAAPPAPPPPQLLPARSGSTGSHPHAPQQQQQPRRASAPRIPQSIAEHPDPRQHGSRAWLQEPEAGESDGAGGSQAQPKAYLRRRSSKIQPRKVDWSHVKPRTNSRNPDYYVDHSPDVFVKARMSPLSSPRGGVTKPPLGINAGSIRAKKAAPKMPFSPTEDDRGTPMAAAAAVPKRRASNIPLAPPVPVASHAALAAAVDERRAVGAVAGGAGAVGRGGMSPLDDLLAHVNTLLRDFDKVVM